MTDSLAMRKSRRWPCWWPLASARTRLWRGGGAAAGLVGVLEGYLSLPGQSAGGRVLGVRHQPPPPRPGARAHRHHLPLLQLRPLGPVAAEVALAVAGADELAGAGVLETPRGGLVGLHLGHAASRFRATWEGWVRAPSGGSRRRASRQAATGRSGEVYQTERA